MAGMKTLCDAPQRCPLAEESQQLQAEVRLLLYGKRNRRYKIYFAIHKDSRLRPATRVRSPLRWRLNMYTVTLYSLPVDMVY
jgi:hypothetical protein